MYVLRWANHMYDDLLDDRLLPYPGFIPGKEKAGQVAPSGLVILQLTHQ